MSKFTTAVRWICETCVENDLDLDVATPTQIITTAAPRIFNFDFPIYDERYRLPLEVKILRHFYTMEICEETVALWKLRLEDRLNVIMPWYNQLYKSTLLEFNPFYDTDYQKDSRNEENGTKVNETNEHIAKNNSRERVENRESDLNSTVNGNVNKQSESDSTTVKNSAEENDANFNEHNTKLFSDTPQGSLEIFGIETPPDQTVVGNSWLTTAEMNDTNGSSHGEKSGNENISGQATGSETESSVNVRNDEATAQINGNETEEGNTNRVQNDSGTITNLNEYIEHVKGKVGTLSYSKMLLEFRETFLNIDKMIIDELDDLFFGLWN